MLKGNRIYFPVESLTGIGHFNRTGKVVQEIVKNEAEVFVASGTFLDAERFFAGANLITMPEYVFHKDEPYAYKLDNEGHEVRIDNFDATFYTTSRINAHIKNFNNINPNIIMCEYWPFDRADLDNEMLELLKYSKQKSNGKNYHILSVRDILNISSDNSRTEFIVDVINNFFDILIIYGDPNFISFEETFPSLNKITTKIIYSGYVINNLPVRASLLEEYVLLSCGSGEGAAPMINCAVNAWEYLLQNKLIDKKLHIVCGPRFPLSEYRKISDRVENIKKQHNCKIILELYRKDFNQLMANAFFSISFAGYNTSLEVIALNIPRLFIPKYRFYSSTNSIKINSEQLYRLQKLQDKNIAAYILPEEIEVPDIFGNRIVDEITKQTEEECERITTNTHGAVNTVKEIKEVIK